MAKTGIVCVGCDKDTSELGEYDEDSPAREDGTYADNKIVCTNCYIRLIPLGLDVGPPTVIQLRMKALRRQDEGH